MVKNSLNLNESRDSFLFLHNEVYTSLLYYEYTIFAAYLGVKNINCEVIKCLNNLNNSGEINNVLQNMKFYKDILTPLKVHKLDNTIISNINNENIKLNSSSSCLIPNIDGNGYKMNVRYVNYYINGNGNYLDCDKHIIT